MDNEVTSVSARAALQRLREGNTRFIHAEVARAEVSPGLRERLAAAQHPYAVVVSCSDSRVVPEHMFSAGLGELFVVRTAGNVVDDVVAGSVAYAVDHLGTRLVVVLGHTGCGAVGATLDGGHHGSADAVMSLIASAIGDERDALRACEANVHAGMSRLRDVPEIAHFAQVDGLLVVGAVYDTATGEVRWL